MMDQMKARVRTEAIVTLLVLAAWCVTLSVTLNAANVRTITWTDLVSKQEPYDDPFVKLTPSQIADLSLILVMEKAPEEIRSDRKKVEKVDAARARLTDAGLDTDYLFAQRKIVMEKRRQLATSINTELVGEAVRLPGYLLPLERDGRDVIEFLLVPTVGACIHTPPPPLNQIVHVAYPSGFDVEAMFAPVWITGKLTAETSSQDVGYSDGRATVTVGYRIDAQSVVSYE